MKEKIKKLGIQRIICCLFYACLCVFSITVGLYYLLFENEVNLIELSKGASEFLIKILPISITQFFGLLTIGVGVIQGLSAYGIFSTDKPKLYNFATSFTIFSLISCSSKLFMSINAFSICKIVLYIIVLILLIMNKSQTAK